MAYHSLVLFNVKPYYLSGAFFFKKNNNYSQLAHHLNATWTTTQRMNSLELSIKRHRNGHRTIEHPELRNTQGESSPIPGSTKEHPKF